MSSQTVKERGTRDLHRPGISPDLIVTILDPRHPRHEARNPAEYVTGNEIFDNLVRDWMSSVGYTNAPRAAWVVTDKKTKAGYWLAVDGSKRIEAAKVGNRLLCEAGGLARDIAFDSDIGQDMNLTAVKGIASQYTRAIESAYTTARDAATLLGRAWGGEETGNEAPIEAALDRLRYRGKRLSETMITEALDPAKGFPNATPGLVEAMHGGMGWSAALRISAKDHEEQDRILAVLRQGLAPFVTAGGAPDEFWETVTTRDVTDAIGGRFETPTFKAPASDADETPARDSCDPGPASPTPGPAPAKVRPERVKTKIGTSPKVRPSSTRAMLDQAEVQLKGATGKRLVELRAIHALLQILSTEGGTAEDADQIASMDSIYQIARAVQD